MVAAAQAIVQAASASFQELGIGIGLNFGTAWVGNVGKEDMKEFTALGDVVNVAARLQGCAGPGEIVMSEAVFSRMASPPSATTKSFAVKGKSAPLRGLVTTASGGGGLARDETLDRDVDLPHR
jgi:adenylate cyclase